MRSIIVVANISREARLMTDEAKMYKKLRREFAEHARRCTALAATSITATAPSTRTPWKAPSLCSSVA